MTTSRLAKSTAPTKSPFHAWEWLEMARHTGDKNKTNAWEKAVKDNWDDDHFCPEAAEAYRNRVARG